MRTQTLEAPTLATDDVLDRPGPQPLDTVRFRGADATIVRVRPTGLVDLIQYGPGGKPHAFDRIAHGLEYGAWSYPGEAPPPPPTLDELIDRAEAEGKPVPRAGAPVVLLVNVERNLPTIWQEIVGRRARVLRPLALDRCDVEVFANPYPPLDPDDPDEVAFVVQNVPHDPSGVRPQTFAYPSDGFVPPGRQRITDARPRYRCSLPGCGRGADPGVTINFPGLGDRLLCPQHGSIAKAWLGDFLAGKILVEAAS